VTIDAANSWPILLVDSSASLDVSNSAFNAGALGDLGTPVETALLAGTDGW
jgi:hypothetical protein